MAPFLPGWPEFGTISSGGPEFLLPDLDLLRQDNNILSPDKDILRPDIDILRQDIDILRPDIDILRQDIDILSPKGLPKGLQVPLDVKFNDSISEQKNINTLYYWNILFSGA